MSAALVLEIRNVSFVAGHTRLLDSLDLTVAAGERVGMVGRSGNGKSLLAALALGLAMPLSGSIALFEQDLATADVAHRRRLRARCGVSVQGGSLLSQLTVEQNLRLGMSGTPARMRRKLDRLMLDFAVERSGGAEVGALSRGERARVELARVFTRDPALVILDEPLDGVRSGAAEIERVLMRQILPYERTLLLLTQDEAFARRTCTRVLRLDRGRLVPDQQDVAARS